MSTTDEPSNVIPFPCDYREDFAGWLAAEYLLADSGSDQQELFQRAASGDMCEAAVIVGALPPGPDREIAQRFVACISAWARRRLDWDLVPSVYDAMRIAAVDYAAKHGKAAVVALVKKHGGEGPEGVKLWRVPKENRATLLAQLRFGLPTQP